MKKLKYLFTFLAITGVVTLTYVIWFLKWVILAGVVMYSLYKVDQVARNIKLKFQKRKGK